MKALSPEFERAPHFLSQAEALFHGIDQPVSVLCRVTGVSRPIHLRDRAHYILELSDFADSTRFRTLPTGDRELYHQAQRALQLGQRVVAYGRFVPDHIDDPRPRAKARPAELYLDLHALRRQSRPTQLLEDDGARLARVDALIDSFKDEPGGLRRHIEDTLFSITGAAVASMSNRFRDCVLLVILQALSRGQVNPGVNPRISAGFFSSSGTGKGLLTEFARLLAPVATVVQPGLLSVAGLGARIEQRDGQWQAHPGVFPNASGGIAAFDDLHRVPKNLQQPVQAMLMTVTQEARVAPAKAAVASYESACGVLINANPLPVVGSEIDPEGPQARLQYLVVMWDLVTRLDTMINVSTGDNAEQSAEDIAAAPAQPEDCEDIEDPKLAERIAELRLLIARLQERHPVIRMDGVATKVRQVMRELAAVLNGYAAPLKGQAQDVFNVAGLLRRAANCLRKIIAALARLEGRDYATDDDVERAWAFWSYKMEFIKWICGQDDHIRPLGARQRQVELALRAANERFRKILLNYGGLDLSAAQMAAGLGISERTVRRDLRERGFKPVLGRYSLPTLLEWDRKIREAEIEAMESAATHESAADPSAAAAQDGAPAGMPAPVVFDEDDEEAAATESSMPEYQISVQEQCGVSPLPPALDVAVEVLNRAPDRARKEMGELLAEVAKEEHPRRYDGMAINIWERLKEINLALPDPVWDLLMPGQQDAVYGRLVETSWERRGRAALQLYAYAELESGGLSSIKTEGMPEKLQKELRAVIRLEERLWREWLAKQQHRMDDS